MKFSTGKIQAREGLRRLLVVGAILGFICCCTLVLPVPIFNRNDQNGHILAPLQPHSASEGYPIYIVGDAGWQTFKDAGNCTGDGSSANPFVIRDIFINASGAAPCIYVVNSTACFRVENCTLVRAATGTAGIMLDNVTNGKLLNNNCTQGPAGILLNTCRNCSVEANNVTGNTYGIVLNANCTGNAVLRNNATNNMCGICVQDFCTANNISANYLTDNSGDGMLLIFNSSRNSVTGNILARNGLKGLFVAQNSSSNVIRENQVVNNTRSGIYTMNWCAENLVADNNASANGEEGIRVEDHSANNTIRDNRVINNTGHGLVVVDTSGNNTFVHNYVVGNKGRGANVSAGCNGNLFYWNNFSANEAENARDDGTWNRWDNGTIGNFWGNYAGFDLNDDGIGDDPQDVAGSADVQDRFPIWVDEDLLTPTIKINYPLAYTLFGASAPFLNATCFDLNLNATWYTVGADPTPFFFEGSIVDSVNTATWATQLNGTVTITVWANDTLGRLASMSVIVHKDVLPPVVTIHEPEDRESYGADPPAYNITISEGNLDSVWLVIYTWQGAVSYVLPGLNGTIPQDIWDQVPFGTHRARVYANDSTGNVGYAEVTIVKQVGGIAGFPVDIVVVVTLAGIGSILVRFKNLRRKR